MDTGASFPDPKYKTRAAKAHDPSRTSHNLHTGGYIPVDNDIYDGHVSVPENRVSDGTTGGCSLLKKSLGNVTSLSHPCSNPMPGSDDMPRGLHLCRVYGSFAQELLKFRQGRLDKLSIRPEISFRAMASCKKLVSGYLDAWKNPVYLPFSLQQIVEAVSKGASKEDALKKLYPQGLWLAPDGSENCPLVRTATMFVDRDGLVVAWYIPYAFSAQQVDRVYLATERLSKVPNSILKDPTSGTSWRMDANTICWYNQGWGAHNSTPAPSVNLRDPDGGAMDFLEDMERVNCLISGLLAIIHPELYKEQVAVLEELALGRARHSDREVMMEAFKHWATPFTGFALISNRETPFHRDSTGGKTLFDILAAFGRYRNGRFEVPLLNSRFMYNPGTAITLPGGLLQHGRVRRTVRGSALRAS
ncbi:hypothetical protein NMY22_g8206 [Coprinellus aureogranulatus]|nr:hypothetical protein NMY22_g8206 [Coprinellus aureogranulatus]